VAVTAYFKVLPSEHNEKHHKTSQSGALPLYQPDQYIRFLYILETTITFTWNSFIKIIFLSTWVCHQSTMWSSFQ